MRASASACSRLPNCWQNPPAQQPEVNVAEKQSLLDQCRAIYKEEMDKARVKALKRFTEKLGLSDAHASTYFYKIKKEQAQKS